MSPHEIQLLQYAISLYKREAIELLKDLPLDDYSETLQVTIKSLISHNPNKIAKSYLTTKQVENTI